MKKFMIAMIVILAVGALLIGVGCAVYFSGDNKFHSVDPNYVESTYVAEQGFNDVNLNFKGWHQVTFKHGDAFSVRYFNSDLSTFSIKNENGTLTVSEDYVKTLNWLDRLKFNIRKTDVEITVTNETVLSLGGEISGSTDVNLPDWNFSGINLKVSGSANLRGANLKIGEVKLDVAGSADVNIGGEFKVLNFKASGSADINVSGKADSLTVNSSGSVDIEALGFTCPYVEINSAGSLDAELSGTGDKLKVSSSGSCDIEAEYFALSEVNIDSSGSIDAELKVSNTLNVHSSGSADIEYYGNPQISTSGSGRPRIVKKG